ncbi:type 1 glutamine amidotransferase [Fundicoccus culcitae]|uniref:Type 1 glutamine amidotransferase n=2 Tax=Fundicoccus culcitae TaxID=2969821 RepID=A0ABY5P378_9LACT|nr:type 1 glutamine amidotransferase [Fundicoccus culcitae]
MMAKVATVITKLFEDVEFTSPKEALVAAGHEVITIGFNAGEIIEGKKGQARVTIEKAIDEVNPADFDALLIPGGYSPDQLRKDDRFLDFTRHFALHQKPIFSICHGPQLLVNAGVLSGRNITAVKQVAIDVKNAGANFFDEAVVIDPTGLISSRTPEDLPAFNAAIVNALK